MSPKPDFCDNAVPECDQRGNSDKPADSEFDEVTCNMIYSLCPLEKAQTLTFDQLNALVLSVTTTKAPNPVHEPLVSGTVSESYNSFLGNVLEDYIEIAKASQKSPIDAFDL